MAARCVVPVDLEEIPPGAALAAALERIDVGAISGFDVVRVMKARQRQLSHDHALLSEAVVESGRRSDPEFGREAIAHEFRSSEARAALVLTRRAAMDLHGAAEEIIERLPEVHGALRGGLIDPARAEAFRSWTQNLTDEQAQAICDRLLPDAPGLTVGQLTERIRQQAIAIDPEWSRKQREAGVARRKVVAYANPDGTATVAAERLSPEAAVSTTANLSRLARAAKRAGDPRSLDELRADIHTALTDGTTTGMDEDALLRHILATGPDPDTEEPPAGAPVPNVTVRPRMSTLLGHDDRPVDMPGWGPIDAHLARDLVRKMGPAQWSYLITHTDGTLAHTGLLRSRPAGTSPRAGTPGAVEIIVTATDLEELDRLDRRHRWAPLARELLRLDREWRQNPVTPEDDRDPTRRLPGKALRRYLQGRDQTCFFHGCRAPAHAGQVDHTIRHTDHGPTKDVNLGYGCEHDHRLKDEGGWKVIQLSAGHFCWTSRLGHPYDKHPPRHTDDLIEPLPRDDDPYQPLDPAEHDPEQHLAEGLRLQMRPPLAPDISLPESGDDDEPPF